MTRAHQRIRDVLGMNFRFMWMRIYDKVTLHIIFEDCWTTDKREIHKWTTKLLTLALNDVFKHLHCDNKEINIDSRDLNHHCFEDDIISCELEEIKEMFSENEHDRSKS